MEKKRYDNLDLLKFIAVLMVLALHVPLFYCRDITPGDFGAVVNYFSRLVSEAVPIFVMVNGFLLLPKEKISLKKHYLKVLKLVTLFIVWGLVYIVFLKYTEGILWFLRIEEIIQIFTERIDSSIYISQLGFIKGLVFVYLVYPFVWKLYKDKYSLYVLMWIGLFVVVGGLNTLGIVDYLLRANNIVFPWINRYVTYTLIPVSREWWYLIYFMFGGFIFRYRDIAEKKRILFIVIGFIGIVTSWALGYAISIKGDLYKYAFNQRSVFEVMYLGGLYALTLDYRNKTGIVSRFIRSVADNSFGIYLLNIPVIRFVNVYINEWYRYPKALLYLLSFAICYVLSIIARKIPVAKWFVTL